MNAMTKKQFFYHKDKYWCLHTECEMMQKELGAKATLVDTHELLEGGRERMTVVLEAAQIEARTELLQEYIAYPYRNYVCECIRYNQSRKADFTSHHIIINILYYLVLRPLSAANH